jgi:predicted transcriptional regulator
MGDYVNQLIRKAEVFGYVGVIQTLLFLREGKKKATDFETVMPFVTFSNARRILKKLEWIKEEKGEHHLSKIYRLTDIGMKVAENIPQLLEHIPDGFTLPE